MQICTPMHACECPNTHTHTHTHTSTCTINSMAPQFSQHVNMYYSYRKGKMSNLLHRPLHEFLGFAPTVILKILNNKDTLYQYTTLYFRFSIIQN